jgi:uncharacterized membrane protein YphA (DoxX/SURF4 family)
MNAEPVTKGLKIKDVMAVLVRWVLGGLFVYMGLKKALDPAGFLTLVRQYDMVSSPFVLNSIAAALPWFEVFCGLLLLAGVAVRGTAVVVVAMLVPFTLLILKRALAVASAQKLAFCMVKFDCGCGNGEVFICNKLLENSLLILLACWLISGVGRKLSLRFSLLQSPGPAQVASAA